jgi:hypothetical protein
MLATSLARLIHLDLIIIVISGDHTHHTAPNFSFLQSPVIYSLLGPNVIYATLFCNDFSLCSFLSMKDQVSHPWNIMTNSNSFYCNIYLLHSKQESKIFWTEGKETLAEFNTLFLLQNTVIECGFHKDGKYLVWMNGRNFRSKMFLWIY